MTNVDVSSFSAWYLDYWWQYEVWRVLQRAWYLDIDDEIDVKFEEPTPRYWLRKWCQVWWTWHLDIDDEIDVKFQTWHLDIDDEVDVKFDELWHLDIDVESDVDFEEPVINIDDERI